MQIRLTTAFACIAMGASALPASALAQSTSGGGAQAPTSTSPTALTTTPLGPDTLEQPSGGIIVNEVAGLQGELEPTDNKVAVALQALNAKTGWTTIASAVTGPGGVFTVHFRPHSAGMLSLRAVPTNTASQTTPADAASLQTPVLHSDIASWFGPGFYGQQTACGETMTPQLVGIAHPSLPCGTLVAISYAGHEITVPVVDRGPYSAGVNIDLTTATALQLGVTDTVRVGALAVG